MFNLLIVDDEKYSVAGITQGIDWTDLPIDNIYEAYSAKQAKELMNRVNVDLLISDIEMPGDNGIQLLEWTREQFPETETIFLTGHANFSYAQQAVHLGSYEYIVKPIDYEELKQVVGKALKEIGDKREARVYQETYRRYHDRWVQQKPLLIERFWQDLLSRRISSSPDTIDEAIHLYNLPLSSRQTILPILISVEQWNKELDTRDEEIMEYAIRNSAAEILLADGRGAVLQDRSGVNVALLYDGIYDEAGMERLRDRCRSMLEAAKRYFYCEISCYIGEGTELSRLPGSYRTLLELEQDNVADSNDVFMWSESAGRTVQQVIPFAPVDDWLVLFEAGNKQELLRRLEDTVKAMRERDATADMVDMLTTSIKHLLYRSFHRQGLPIHSGYAARVGIRSLSQFHAWAKQTLEEAFEAYHGQVPDTRAVIDRIHQFVAQHLMDVELKREDIAKHVFLNPAYLSRLYKKETGIALSDYIMHARVEKSKSLLSDTDRKVSDIAEAVGYTNLSHFAKLFRKIVGIGPKEYRQKFNK
ncbi:response regulator [Paenibacillus lignilyticus]|uniref:Response regulator n=1 Tax=Paenibacillus lignilyticus TaxID=1172615 RepID=A0ABS5CIP8_9BACL|nr:response regulator [Paenibacillus lignilyticus]MBP3965679.1 response regulator [Paenibacillus lignilyticus]